MTNFHVKFQDENVQPIGNQMATDPGESNSTLCKNNVDLVKYQPKIADLFRNFTNLLRKFFYEFLFFSFTFDTESSFLFNMTKNVNIFESNLNQSLPKLVNIIKNDLREIMIRFDKFGRRLTITDKDHTYILHLIKN